MKKLIAIISTLALSACATPVALNKQTSSGYPEGIFVNSNVEAVKAKIMNGCSSMGVMVQEVQSNSVVCGKQMSGSDELIATLMMGNRYSSTPERKVRFIIYPYGSNVKVTAQQWMELQMALGQIRKQDLNSNSQNNDVQAFLDKLGAK